MKFKNIPKICVITGGGVKNKFILNELKVIKLE